jgi:hypothetical protein
MAKIKQQPTNGIDWNRDRGRCVEISRGQVRTN